MTIAPLSWNTPIVVSGGRPTAEFQRRWQELINLIGTSQGTSGGTIIIPAATPLAAGNFVSMNSQGLILADPTDDTKPAIGFVRSAFAIRTQALMSLPGQVNDQLSGLAITVPPKPVFLAANGGWTQTIPSSGANQFLGYPISPTQLVFQPGPNQLL
jgi:hypothetical protein